MRYKFSNEEIEEAVRNSDSIISCMRFLNMRLAGGSHLHLSKRIKSLGYDTSHFIGKQGYHSKLRSKKLTHDQILILNSSGGRTRAYLLRRALIESGREYKCEICLLNSWNNLPITLEVDHINSNWLDNRKDNLRFLCPNCHAQITAGVSQLEEEQLLESC